MSINRRRFLDRVRNALHRKTTHGQAHIRYEDLAAAVAPDVSADVLGILAASAVEANIHMTRAADHADAGRAIAGIVRETEAEWAHQDAVISWDHPLLERLNVKCLVEATGTEFIVTHADHSGPLTTEDRGAFREQVMRSRIGITSADYCVAETATLVVRTRPGQPGAVNLVPSVHVAVILASQILPDFVSLYALLEKQQASDPDALAHRMTLITGPSKTGDIELVMVRGAHGPRALHLVVIDDLT